MTDIKVELYSEPYFGGEKLEVWGGIFTGVPIDASMQKEISSIKVIGGVWNFYKTTDFSGYYLQLPPGSYPEFPLGWDEAIASAARYYYMESPSLPQLSGEIYGPPQMDIYEDIDFGGKSETIWEGTGTWNDDDWWKNRISSFKLNNGTVRFYWNEDYEGEILTVNNAGPYQDLREFPSSDHKKDNWNDEVASYKLSQYGIALHKSEFNVPYPSSSVVLQNSSVPYVGDQWNDQIGSVEITGGVWELFEDSNFQGESVLLYPGYTYLRYLGSGDMGFVNRVSSLRLVQDYVGTDNNDILDDNEVEKYPTYQVNNTIALKGGADNFSAGDGDDYIDGGTGGDTLNGGNGSDVIVTGEIDGDNNILRGDNDNENGKKYNDLFMLFDPGAETTSGESVAIEVAQVMLEFTEAVGVLVESTFFEVAPLVISGIIDLVNIFTGKGKEPDPPVWKDMTVIQDFGVEDALILGNTDAFFITKGNATFDKLDIIGSAGTKIYNESTSAEKPIVFLQDFQLQDDSGWLVEKTEQGEEEGEEESQANFHRIYVNKGYENTSSTSTVQNSYIKGVTVFLDENHNNQLDKGELSTTTNENGYYDHSLLETENKEGKLVVFGGEYILDGKPHELVFTAPKEFHHISPLSTLWVEISEQGITQEQLAEHFGIDIHEYVLDEDHIQAFISTYKRDEFDNSHLYKEKVLVNQEIGHLMAVGAEYLVKQGLAATEAEGGSQVISALADVITEAIEEDQPFGLRKEEDLEKVAIAMGINPNVVESVVDAYLAKDMELHLANILSTFDPENDEDTDVIYGSEHRDEIKASTNQEQIIHGHHGKDVIDLTESKPEHHHVVKGDEQRDLILGCHNDQLMGGTGQDTLDASAGGGSNILYGQENKDVLIGGEDNLLHGGPADDTIYAGSGDTLTGGGGHDAFWLAKGELPGKINTVTDFNFKKDVIGLEGIEVKGEPIDFEDLVFTEVAGGIDLGIKDGEKVQPLATFLDLSAEDLNNPANFVIPTPLVGI
ncbi:MAG: hypothetical protein DSM107014_05035 [Gomphosphaeria aponina SAG 52.96 = DSM 107014]|uniref:Beta/gamma crystallin 'Greek key' domain-containing protein n=1 Tax=Gomphosphaeria aponina SAG 52.96 = DSM 107014 TaxID=1521640 RepID=A0A941GN91_9CHRO|nr:hypothetical protein [Gomphosphaeria aponina SAG 52.96 = DSM 107014]